MESIEKPSANSVNEILLVGDHLALDLLNTEMRVGSDAVDLWRSGKDVYAWLDRQGLVAGIAVETAQEPALLKQARELRALARHLIEQWKDGKHVDVQPLNQFLFDHLTAPQLNPDETGKLALTRVSRGAPVPTLLGPVAEAIAQLLAEGEIEYVKTCAHPECILWFYDRTKSHKRRWCSMASCGPIQKESRIELKRPRFYSGARAITLISKSKPASQFTPTAVQFGYGCV
jgi:predicted RNA-binding Zn ribbon-like protein